MAQEEGFEPPTKRLTAACSTAELLLNETHVNMEIPSLCQGILANSGSEIQ